MYQGLIESDCDVSFVFHYNYLEGDKIFQWYYLDNIERRFYSRKEMLLEMNKQNEIRWSPIWALWTAWAKLFRSDLFKSIRFPEVILYEDSPTILKVFLKSNRILQIPEALYCYRIRSGSIMQSNISLLNIQSSIYGCKGRIVSIFLLDWILNWIIHLRSII